MDIYYKLKENAKLTDDQIKEIEQARNYPYIEDEDSPEIDPDKTPDLYEGFLNNLGERNRRIASKAL